MHDGKPLLNRFKPFLNTQTSDIKGEPFRGLMALPNKGALTFDAPKVSNSRGNPDGPSAAFACRQMGSNGAAAQAANDPELETHSVYVFLYTFYIIAEVPFYV